MPAKRPPKNRSLNKELRKKVQSGDPASHTVRALEGGRHFIGKKILEEAGSSLAQVVRITVYLSSPADYAGMNEVYAKFLTDSPPARATVAATFLARSVRVEIDAIAIVSE